MNVFHIEIWDQDRSSRKFSEYPLLVWIWPAKKIFQCPIYALSCQSDRV